MDIKQPLIDNEQKRLEALQRYSILDTLPESTFDDATKLISYICGVPIAHISFIDDKRQWFKSEIGIGVSEVPREISFCQYTIMESEIVEINDTFLNERFKEDPNVTGGFKIRFYVGVPLTTPDGFNIGTLCALDHVVKKLDENQRNALSILAKHIMEHLELRVKNTELDIQKNIAEKALEAKERFLTNMSHEIRTPLNAIIGFTDLLAETNLDVKQRDYISSVQSAGENLFLIINDILDLSKIETGNLTIEQHPFNLIKALKHVYNLLKIKVSKEIEFNLFLDADLPQMIIGDQGRLNQILVNLIGNAIKFTAEGFITIEVKKMEESNEYYSLRFSVKDSGIGIPEDKLKIIFDRFTQVEDNITRRFGGTGLGLNIVKQLVELQGSEIHVKSKEGRGSEFFFLMKYRKTDLIETETISQQEDDLGKLKILMCEDNVINQKLARNVINNFGFEMDIAQNGEEGIALLLKNNYDLILMDLQMPLMDGYQTTVHIRNEMQSNIPIIAMTAHFFPGEKEKCLDIGMNAYIPKPFKQLELLETIKKVIVKNNNHVAKRKIDLSYLEEMACGNSNFKQEMITLFIQKIPTQLTTLVEAFKRNDFAIIQKTAHHMKSSFDMFKLEDWVETMIAIEKEALEAQFSEETKIKINSLNTNIAEVIESLKEH
ncbi:GAF domain-containing hybrid sensor histidine kinase/response regulator [Flavobacterium sp. MAHUQ-51]|uniref:GAF domain-containing hybrid sensor histidine kinase/response regulator n=1 Tax=Flavobacterium sp. GCM10022190 TaxID=3252639 RepID=UPI003608B09D